MKEENDIEQLFRSSFEDFEVAPPAEVKAAIDQKIGGKGKRGVWLLFGLLLLLCTTSVIAITLFGTGHREQTAQNSNGAESKDSSGSVSASRGKITPASSEKNTAKPASVNNSFAQHSGPGIQRQEKNNAAVKNKGTGQKDPNTTGTLLTGNQATGDNPGPATEVIALPSKALNAFAAVDPIREAMDPFGEKMSSPPKDPKWMLSFYGGPNFGINTTVDTSKIAERPSYLLSLEISRYFGAYAVSTGLGYGRRADKFTTSTFTVDSTQWIDSIPIYNGTGDTIIGYNYITVFDTTQHHTYYNRLVGVSAYSLPIYVSRQFHFGSTPWGMQVAAGAVFNLYKTIYLSPDLDGSILTYRSFGVNAVVRAHATYEWNKFLFSAGITGGYDFMPAAVLNGADRRRYYLSPQVGIHWKF